MKRQTQTASVGATRGQIALSKGFAIFQRNQQEPMYDSRKPSQILIRTLPFIKRKQTEDFQASEDMAQMEVKYNNASQDDPEEIYTRPTNTPLERAATTSQQSRQSKSQLRFYIHQVGSNFNTSQTHLNTRKSDKSWRSTFGSNAKMTFGTTTQMPQMLSDDSPQEQINQQYNSLGSYPSSQQYLTASRFKGKDQPLPAAYFPDVNRFSETQKQFFENFMQEEKPFFPNDMAVLSDQEINEEYPFKIQADIPSLENPGSTVAFLNGFPHNFPLMENHYKAAVRCRDELIQMKDTLKEDMENMTRDFSKELEDFSAETIQKQQAIASSVTTDFVKHQGESFALNKEITKLFRDKLNLEADLENAMVKIRNLEDKLYGQEIFNLEPNQQDYQHITQQNLRSDTFSPLSSKRTQFFNKNVIH